jgi:hypothetical protein
MIPVSCEWISVFQWAGALSEGEGEVTPAFAKFSITNSPFGSASARLLATGGCG